jgi:DNA repair protein RadA/Sms
MEGSRPLLIEVQALVDESNGGGHSRRITQGFDSARLNLLLAVLNRHGDIPTYNYDIYINIVGGVKVTEPGIDLAVIFAILSSLKNKVIEQTTCVFGEIGLSGEIRPVHSGLERLLEAQKHGLKKAITPKGNHPKEQLLNFNCEPVSNLSEVMAFFQEKL